MKSSRAVPLRLQPGRRQFLKRSTALAAGGFFPFVMDLNRLAAAAQPSSDYRALVCIFLYGGNDGNNTLIPYSPAQYQQYAALRGDLALPRDTVLALKFAQSGGLDYALHPALAEIADIFGQGKAAFLANVGPLVAPVTKSQYDSGVALLPPQLFSHSDQQTHWQTALPDRALNTGWGGRIADLIQARNSPSAVSLSISIAGNNVLQIGSTVMPYQVATDGAIPLAGFSTGADADPVSRALADLLVEPGTNLFGEAYCEVFARALDTADIVNGAVSGLPSLATVFPESGLGDQLKMVTRLIAARAALGQSRQIFFCSLGDFDTHDNQLYTQTLQLTELSQALSAFYWATVELGVADKVTTFTASDFGRTLVSNGRGSDHGWGNHHMIVGGSVHGGAIYGRFPALALDGPDDAGDGRWIPTTSVDEYVATLARWFGVAPSELPAVVPNLDRFGTGNLGFLEYA